jgi:hypothetical protein
MAGAHEDLYLPGLEVDPIRRFSPATEASLLCVSFIF